MKHVFRGSTNIAEIDYEECSLSLTVTFCARERDGTNRRHLFRGVTPQVVQAFIAAPSAGRFFSEHIRGKYTDSQRLDAGATA